MTLSKMRNLVNLLNFCDVTGVDGLSVISRPLVNVLTLTCFTRYIYQCHLLFPK